MIVVLGSRHDAAATALLERWPHSALCSAEDLVSEGWVWGERRRTWVIDGGPVDDREVTGVFIRRSGVYPEELITTQQTDRAFLAAECRAFLMYALATTGARVVNPVSDGAFGEEALRPERWTVRATELGIAVRPLRLTNDGPMSLPSSVTAIEVAAGEVFGHAPALRDRARALTSALSLAWCVLLFDEDERLITITTARPPGDAAVPALHRWLERRS
jgi:hypothetical protein